MHHNYIFKKKHVSGTSIEIPIYLRAYMDCREKQPNHNVSVKSKLYAHES